MSVGIDGELEGMLKCCFLSRKYDECESISTSATVYSQEEQQSSTVIIRKTNEEKMNASYRLGRPHGLKR